MGKRTSDWHIFSTLATGPDGDVRVQPIVVSGCSAQWARLEVKARLLVECPPSQGWSAHRIAGRGDVEYKEVS